MKEKKAQEAHHELGPSALKYVEICPGYRSENVSSPWAEEGTMLHEARCDSVPDSRRATRDQGHFS